LTALYGQTGDTLTCFNNQELKNIATKLIYAKECDTVKTLLEQKVTLKDSIITSLDKAIVSKDLLIMNKQSILVMKDTIIKKREQDIKLLIDQATKTKNKIKWLHVGWAATATTLVGIIITSFAVR
jgi:hypothetical protein